jgi:cyclopropane fatty-acyl-phospholipid synthase-like methyltransferase
VGRVLDVGCGTGEHVLMASALGLEAVGIDLSPTAIALAEAKARARGLAARFAVADVLELRSLDERFDTVLDCGLFHVLGDDARVRFAAGLRDVMARGGRYHMLCFSDAVPGTFGPRRISREDIRATFAVGWTIESIAPTTLTRLESTVPVSQVSAWHATIAAT